MRTTQIASSTSHVSDGFNARVFQWIIENYFESTVRILDVGCSSGSLGRALKENNSNFAIYGVEASYPAFLKAKERLDDVWLIDLTVDLFELAEVLTLVNPHIVILADVLEHLNDPERVLRCIAKNMQLDALLCISLPNIFSYELFDKYNSGIFSYDSLGVFDNTHVKFFNLQSAIQLLEKVGFKVAVEPSFFLMNERGRNIFSENIDKLNREMECVIDIGNVSIRCDSAIRLLELASYGFMMVCRLHRSD